MLITDSPSKKVGRFRHVNIHRSSDSSFRRKCRLHHGQYSGRNPNITRRRIGYIIADYRIYGAHACHPPGFSATVIHRTSDCFTRRSYGKHNQAAHRTNDLYRMLHPRNSATISNGSDCRSMHRRTHQIEEPHNSG